MRYSFRNILMWLLSDGPWDKIRWDAVAKQYGFHPNKE